MRAIRYSLRSLARNPAFSAVIVLLLAFGIGANTLIFTAVDVLLLRDLPVDHPEQLVRLQDIHPNGFRSFQPTFPVSYRHLLLERAKSLEDVFSALDDELSMEAGGHTQSVTSEDVSGNYYSVLGIHPLLGRLIGPDDDRCVILSYAFWRRVFNGRSDVIGEKVRLRGTPFTIVGVTPRGFNHLSVEGGPDIAIPSAAEYLWLDPRVAVPQAQIFGRLRPGVSVGQASAEVEALYQGLVADTSSEFLSGASMTEDQKRDYLKSEKSLRVVFDPVSHGTSILLRKQFAVAVKVLMGAVGTLLLLISANIAGLMLARGEASRKEIAVRLSLGATRFAVASQLLMDALLLSILGASAAMFIARFGGGLLLRYLPARWSLNLELIPDTGVLAFAAGICIATTLSMSLVPALHVFRVDLTTLMGRSGPRQRRSHAGVALIALQVALSAILLIGGGALIKTLHQLRNADLGLDRRNLIVMFVNPAVFSRKVGPQRGIEMQAQIDQMVARAKGLPGVEGVSTTGFPQMRGMGPKMSVQPTGTFIRDSDFLNTTFGSVSVDHFQNSGIRILAGRDFQPSDIATKPMPTIVTQAFAKRFFPNQDPIGKTFGSGMNINAKADYQIVGVVNDVKFRSMREEAAPIFFNATDKFYAVTLYVRTRVPPAPVIAELRSMLASIGPGMAPSEVATMEQDIETSLWQERLVAALASVFAVASAVLVAIGLYGMLAYSIARRTREIGIRMALGARPADLIEMISRDVLLSVGPGLVLGVAVYAACARVISPVLYGVRPMDAISILAAIAMIGIVATLAGFIPTRRAIQIEPSEALRQD